MVFFSLHTKAIMGDNRGRLFYSRIIAMTLTARHYHDFRDLKAMQSVLMEGRQSGSRAYYVHPGDLSWWLYYSDESNLVDHICLWELNSRLAGWSLLSDSCQTFDVFVRPELHGRSFEAKIMLWAEEAQADRLRQLNKNNQRTMWVAESDIPRRQWLELRGFKTRKEGMYTMQRSLEKDLPELTLPAGFKVRPVAGVQEARKRATASFGAFGSSRPFEEYWPRMKRFMKSPVYRPDLDLVTVAPDGRFASFCILWPDELNRMGYFEPVGTHPDFQNQGLGKAVLTAGLKRLRELGMAQVSVCVETDNANAMGLYEGMGFIKKQRLLTYEKNLA